MKKDSNKNGRINFDKDFKPHLLCDIDEGGGLYPANAYIMFFDRCVWCCDRTMLLRVEESFVSSLPEESISALEGKILHMNDFKKLLTHDVIVPLEDKIECRKLKSDKIEYIDYLVKDNRHRECVTNAWRGVYEKMVKESDYDYGREGSFKIAPNTGNRHTFSTHNLYKIMSVLYSMFTFVHIVYKKDERKGGYFAVFYPFDEAKEITDRDLCSHPFVVFSMEAINPFDKK